MIKKKKIYVILIIIFIFSSMFLISYLFEREIQKENENLAHNRFLEKISIVVNDISYDKIKENSAFNLYECLKNDSIVAFIALYSGKGLTDNYLIAISFVKNEKNELLIHNYKFIDYGEKDKKYVLMVDDNDELKDKIINKNINQAIEMEIISGATISSDELYKALNDAIEKIKEYKENE